MMNKKLIAIAIGAALGTLPLASQAGVKIYGHAQVEVADEQFDDSFTIAGTTSSGKYVDGRTVEDNARGRWGIKASEKLGNGMKAFAQFEWKVNTAETGATNSTRVMQVGLKGGWGTFMLGALKTPYKYTGGVKYDPFVTTNAEARTNGGMTGGGRGSQGSYGHNSFMSNAVGYKSPNLNGFSFWMVYSPDEHGTSKGSDGDWSAAVKYSAGLWEVFLAGVADKCADDTTTAADECAGIDDYRAWKVGGKVKFGNHTFVLQYEDFDGGYMSVNTGGTLGLVTLAQAGSSTESADGRIWFLGYHLKWGNNLFVVQYGDGDQDYRDVGIVANDDWQYWTIGVIHKFSKTARAFAAYSRTDGSSSGSMGGFGYSYGADRRAITFGLRKDFAT